MRPPRPLSPLSLLLAFPLLAAACGTDDPGDGGCSPLGRWRLQPIAGTAAGSCPEEFLLAPSEVLVRPHPDDGAPQFVLLLEDGSEGAGASEWPCDTVFHADVCELDAACFFEGADPFWRVTINYWLRVQAGELTGSETDVVAGDHPTFPACTGGSELEVTRP